MRHSPKYRQCVQLKVDPPCVLACKRVVPYCVMLPAHDMAQVYDIKSARTPEPESYQDKGSTGYEPVVLKHCVILT